MARKIRPAHHHQWAARDGRRAVLAALLLIFVAATSLADGKLLPTFTPDATSPDAIADQRKDDDNLRTGSILVTPADGNICEHRLIDNETWRVRPNGAIQCDAAVTWRAQGNGAYTSQSRLEAIRDGFVAKR